MVWKSHPPKLQKTLKKWKYKPQKCEVFCPYYETCRNEGTIIQALIQDHKVFQLIGNEDYATLDEAYTQLQRNLKEAVLSSKQGIHLIRAQTGLGKTEAYIRIISETLKQSFVVAFPTIITREEGLKRLLESGVRKEEIFTTPTVRNNPFIPPEIQEEILQLHEKGIHNQTKEVVRRCLREIDPGSTKQQEELRAVMAGMKAYSGQRIILTTHAYLLRIGEEYLTGKTIIIDEDILIQALNTTHEVSEEALKLLVRFDINGYAKIANIMLNSPVGSYMLLGNIRSCCLTPEELNCLSEKGYEGNINDLCRARAFIRKKEKEDRYSRFLYYCPMALPATKVVVLSATLNARIYQKYFSEREVIKYPELKARYRGKLIQYTRHTLGRKDLKEKQEAFAFARSFFNGQDPVFISFKKFTNIKINEAPVSLAMHYGNSMGVNEFAGRNLAVIGTAFHHPDAEKLVAIYLGANVNTKSNYRPERRRIEYSGYSFVIPTYDDELLREIQLYGIQTEMEQSIGRARLLRNECSVLVLSAFPCEQAVFHAEDYLRDHLKESEQE